MRFARIASPATPPPPLFLDHPHIFPFSVDIDDDISAQKTVNLTRQKVNVGAKTLGWGGMFMKVIKSSEGRSLY